MILQIIVIYGSMLSLQKDPEISFLKYGLSICYINKQTRGSREQFCFEKTHQ